MDIPWRVYGRGGDGRFVFWIYFAYAIGWIGIIGPTIPRTKDRIPPILVLMQWKSSEPRMEWDWVASTPIDKRERWHGRIARICPAEG